MRAGAFKRVIVVQRATATVNAAGTPTTTWGDHKRLRAEVVEQSADEFLTAGGARDRRTVVFRTRYVTDVTPADRVAFNGATHNIRNVLVLGQKVGLELRCETAGGAA